MASALPAGDQPIDPVVLEAQLRSADLAQPCTGLAADLAAADDPAPLLPVLREVLAEDARRIGQNPEMKWQGYRPVYNQSFTLGAEACVVPLLAALQNAGPAAAELLCWAVREHPLVAVRATAIESLTAIPPRQAWDDPRLAASVPRSHPSSHETAQCLAEALGDRSDMVRLTALRGLETENADFLKHPAILDRLVDLMMSGDAGIRGQAATSLEKAGTEGTAALIAALQDPKREPHVREEVGVALRKHGKVAIRELDALLDHPDPLTGDLAAVTLAHLGEGRRVAARLVDSLVACHHGRVCHSIDFDIRSTEDLMREARPPAGTWTQLEELRRRQERSCKLAAELGPCVLRAGWFGRALAVAGPEASDQVKRLAPLTSSEHRSIADAAFEGLDAIGEVGCGEWLGLEDEVRWDARGPRWADRCQ